MLSLHVSVLFIMRVVAPLSAFFSTMFLSCDSCLRAFCFPYDRLSFGLFNLILASSNRKVSRATDRGLNWWVPV